MVYKTIFMLRIPCYSEKVVEKKENRDDYEALCFSSKRNRIKNAKSIFCYMPCRGNEWVCSKNKYFLIFSQNSSTKELVKTKTANQCSLTAYIVLDIKREKKT